MISHMYWQIYLNEVLEQNHTADDALTPKTEKSATSINAVLLACMVHN